MSRISQVPQGILWRKPIRLEDITLNVIDTAGIRDTDDIVEKIGVEKARNAADAADLIIYVVDGSCPLDENDEEILKFIKDRKAVVLLNKSDLTMEITADMLASRKDGAPCDCHYQQETGTGIELLENKIKDHVL